MTNKESSACPHCGLEFGKGYGGTPLCQLPWGGVKPGYPHCILRAAGPTIRVGEHNGGPYDMNAGSDAHPTPIFDALTKAFKPDGPDAAPEPTPRTDACQGSDGTLRECDELAECARLLERELVQAKADLSAAETARLAWVTRAQMFQSQLSQAKADLSRMTNQATGWENISNAQRDKLEQCQADLDKANERAKKHEQTVVALLIEVRELRALQHESVPAAPTNWKHRNCPDENGGCYFADEPNCPACNVPESVPESVPVALVISEMIDRFLSWPLPRSFAPDCGISFDERKPDEWNKEKSWPIGTNLFTADEARKMFEYALATTPPKQWCSICHSKGPEHIDMDAAPAPSEEVAILSKQISASFKLAAKVVCLPTDDKDRIERNLVCDAVYKWRTTIDAARRKEGK